MPYSVCRNLKAIFEKAINQLTTITIHNEADLNFKCPYHANIINTFEAVSKTIGKKYFILKKQRRDITTYNAPLKKKLRLSQKQSPPTTKKAEKTAMRLNRPGG